MSNPSVQLYSVRQEFSNDPQGTLRRIAEIGFRQVEPYGLVDHRAALEKAFNIKTIRQLGSNKFFAVAAALVRLEEAG